MFLLEAAYVLFLLWLIAAGCSLAHVLIIPEGTLKRKRPRG